MYEIIASLCFVIALFVVTNTYKNGRKPDLTLGTVILMVLWFSIPYLNIISLVVGILVYSSSGYKFNKPVDWGSLIRNFLSKKI